MKLLLHSLDDNKARKLDLLFQKNNYILTLANNEEFIKENWKDITEIFDCSSNHFFYNKCLKKSTELKDGKTEILVFNNRKIFKLDNVLNFFFKKENFSKEDYEVIMDKKREIKRVLKKYCSLNENNKIESILNSPIKFENINVVVVKDNKENQENVIDISDFELLKEIKDILKCLEVEKNYDDER